MNSNFFISLENDLNMEPSTQYKKTKIIGANGDMRKFSNNRQNSNSSNSEKNLNYFQAKPKQI